jgi:hypothetical protein
MSTDYTETNRRRADRVREFVESYRAEWEGGSESLVTAIADIVADLAHYVDHLPEEEWDDPYVPPNGDTVVERGLWHYHEEVDFEREDALANQ